jgi:uncharacterized phage protein (TIGR01671 family)
MREIKFRGKAKMSIEELDDLYLEHENGWVYGHLVMYGKTPYIVGDFIEVDSEYTVNEFWVPVYPESVGQFTGLPDKNGKEIYEGDICETVTYSGKPFGTIDVVKFSGGAFKLTDIEDALLPIPLDDSDIQSVEVIGNIFEHPHLIGGKHG